MLLVEALLDNHHQKHRSVATSSQFSSYKSFAGNASWESCASQNAKIHRFYTDSTIVLNKSGLPHISAKDAHSATYLIRRLCQIDNKTRSQPTKTGKIGQQLLDLISNNCRPVEDPLAGDTLVI